MSISTQYVTLGVAGNVFGISVERVQEILEPQAVAEMPNAPPTSSGIIDVRGEGVPVIDLRCVWECRPRPTPRTPVSSCSKQLLAGARRKVGLRTDRVFEVTSRMATSSRRGDRITLARRQRPGRRTPQRRLRHRLRPRSSLRPGPFVVDHGAPIDMVA